MCGICGLVGFRETQSSLERMLSFLKHRGPDNIGLWTDEAVGLGHSRLSIVDLSSSANQPMPNETRTIWLVGNGEIYNSHELRRTLEERGHHFRSRSDNEVLLHYYEEEGEAFLPRINGMLAMAIWDHQRKRLLLARDRLGIKPLYYFIGNGGLVFASEIKALLASSSVRSNIDPVGLKQYLTFENTFGRTTLHKYIHMVEPGQYLIWENGACHTDLFWRPAFRTSQTPRFQDACHTYLETAERSVQRHLMGDVEVASYLSSGIDSSTVSTLATRHKSRPLSTYTASFGLRGWYDETPGAFTLANQLGSQHNIVEITTHSLKREMDDLIFSLDEPRMGTGSFSQYMLAKAAAEKFKVILTGHGGDELFAGYPIFKLMQLLQEFKIGSPVNRQGLCSLRYSELPHLVYFLLRRLRSDGAAAYLPVLFSDTLLSRGLLPEVYEQIKSINPEDDLRQLVGNEADPYHQLTLVYLRAYLPGLFVVEDKISMAHSLESRTPLCDNELVDFSLSLPLSLKLDGGQLKAIPKAAMRNYLPEILYRLPKRGFPTPLAYWLRGELRDWTRQRLLCEDSPLHRIFKMSFLQHLVSSYLGSWRKHIRPLDEIQTHRIWALLSLDSWLRVTENRLGVSLEMN